MLIIIDMQEVFDASYGVIDEVLSYIRKSMKRGDKIVLVEYVCGYVKCTKIRGLDSECICRTHSSIELELDGYKNLIRVFKHQNDGSIEIVNALIDRGLGFPSKVLVCGVNTDFCVRDTIESLATQYGDITFKLLLDACNSSFGGQTPVTYKWSRSYKNVERSL